MFVAILKQSKNPARLFDYIQITYVLIITLALYVIGLSIWGPSSFLVCCGIAIMYTYYTQYLASLDLTTLEKGADVFKYQIRGVYGPSYWSYSRVTGPFLQLRLGVITVMILVCSIVLYGLWLAASFLYTVLN